MCESGERREFGRAAGQRVLHATTPGAKRPAPDKKMAASGEAAKFREETPRKGGGFAGGPAIPRCNKIGKLGFPCKRKNAEQMCIFSTESMDFTRPVTGFAAAGLNQGKCAAQ